MYLGKIFHLIYSVIKRSISGQTPLISKNFLAGSKGHNFEKAFFPDQCHCFLCHYRAQNTYNLNYYMVYTGIHLARLHYSLMCMNNVKGQNLIQISPLNHIGTLI